MSFRNCRLLISIPLQNNIVSFGHEENTFTIDPNHDIIRSQCTVYFSNVSFLQSCKPNIFSPYQFSFTVLLKDRQFNCVFYTTWEESSSARKRKFNFYNSCFDSVPHRVLYIFLKRPCYLLRCPAMGITCKVMMVVDRGNRGESIQSNFIF